jgi:hypothetical protein
MTLDDAVRHALSEMTNPEAPQQRGDVAAAVRHVNVCSYCALKLRDRLAELMGGESAAATTVEAGGYT